MASDRPQFTPLTVNLTKPQREAVEKIATERVLSLSDVVRSMARDGIERRDRGDRDADR